MRVQVNISDEMVETIDMYAHKFGVSRSALCSVAVGQYIDNLVSTKDVINKMGVQIAESIIAEK